MDLAELIKAKAKELGFNKIGIADVSPLSESISRSYRDWIAKGFHGDMEYLERGEDKRFAPANILEGARSIVSVAISYNAGNVFFSADRKHARISRYALGEDYHRVVSEKLEALWEFIEQEAGRPVKGKCFCDTGPLMEKVIAERAGVGWIGKHSILVTEEFGSWIFLGDIVIDIPLAYDKPADNLCSACSLCIEACPTGAIVSPGVVDVSRCISYQTVENRNAIPSEIRGTLENWVYGCDLCQEACPYNSNARITGEKAFLPKPELLSAPLEMLFAVAMGHFDKSFTDSAIIRAKREGFLRNIIVAMGNSCDRRFLPLLRKVQEDADLLLTEHAAWAIGNISKTE